MRFRLRTLMIAAALATVDSDRLAGPVVRSFCLRLGGTLSHLPHGNPLLHRLDH
jgi:hypothetical protein